MEFVEKKLFTKSVENGGLLSIAFYTNNENRLMNYITNIKQSDTFSDSKIRLSDDNLQTFYKEYSDQTSWDIPQGTMTKYFKVQVVDQKNGHLYMFYNQGLLPGNYPEEGLKNWQMYYSMSKDGGETFEIQTTQYPTEAIYMINENEGYAGGANGRVYRTTDGGANWIAIGSIGATLADIDFATTTQGYCCGDNGQVFSITPQGVTNLNSGLAENLAGVCAPSVDNVWVCGIGSILYYNGTTFDFQSGPVGSYNSIFFIDDDEGWVNGDSGLLGHTEDGGNTWTSQSNTSWGAFYDVFFLNTEVGWSVGYMGTILHTTNGGDTWNIEGTGLTTVRLRGVHFTSPTNGYVVGNEKTLLKYTEVSGIEEELQAIVFELFPNPVSDKFEVRLLGSARNDISAEFEVGAGKVELYELSGNKLLEENIEKGMESIEIDVSDLESGMYLCKITIGKRSSTKKIVKE
jgi:photosystem II stability/assembly factor-like uncharacterized protein